MITIGLFLLLTLLVLSKHNYLIYKNKQNKFCNLKFLKYKLQKILNILKCSKNFEFEKRTDQNCITQNVRHGRECRISTKKKLLKQSQKDMF